jgi:sugar-specific transcriptional regulator TrmB
MVEENLVASLEKFGLSNNESKIYLAVLELGLTKVNEISRKTGIVRETTYGIINSLIKKGLISYVIKSGIKHFEASDPSKLKQILKEKEEIIQNILPSLNELKKSTPSKPKVEFYEGKDGMKTVIEDLLTANKEILAISSTKGLRQLFEFYFPGAVKRREELGIKVRMLSDDPPFSRKLLQSKKLPKNFEFNTATWIYNKKVAMISLNNKEPIGIVIEDEEINKTQRNTFELLWKLI